MSVGRPAFVLLCSCVWMHAQEVRRAVPVSLENYDNPPWMDRVQGEVEVRRALPAEAAEVTVRKAVAVESATPVTPSPTPPPLQVPAISTGDAADVQSGIIRIAPGAEEGGMDSALGRANSFFARRMYDLAIPEYEMFLVSGSGSPGRDAALFRLAESHRALGHADAARAAYEKLVMEFQSGEFAAAGAYRLGGVLFAEKKSDAAAAQFDLAAREAKDNGVRLSSAYFAGRSHESAGRIIDAATRYEAVLSAGGENPYRDNAAMALGAIQLKRGENRAALKTFEQLAKAAAEDDVAASAALEAAGIASAAGNIPSALELYGIAVARGDADMKSTAHFQSLLLRYKSGDHAGVVAGGREIALGMPSERRAEALRILAASMRETGDHAGAAALYEEMLADDSSAGEASGLGYQRLLALHASEDKSLPREVDLFLAENPEPSIAASAALLKAEALFQQGAYAEAADAYEAALKYPQLKESQRPAALYKQAWSLSAAGEHSPAVTAYDAFVRTYPQDKLAAGALVQSGLARQKSGDFEGAVRDFDRVLTEYPLSADVEVALLQKALTCGQLKRNEDMAAAFRLLLKKYPKTAAAAQANYWIGWVAYENKDMDEALSRLTEARRLDAKTYGERAALRIILARYQQQDFPGVLAEFEAYNGAPLPPEVLVWIAGGHAAAGDHDKVEQTLKPLLEGGGTVGPDVWILLADSRNALGGHAGAAEAATRYLGVVGDPPSQARGHLARAKALIGMKRFEEARRDIDQALFLQPEGGLNAEARMLDGEVFFAAGDYDSAARSFMAVSVLTDDAETTPRALKRAADAYLRTFNDGEAEKALDELRRRFPSSSLNAGRQGVGT